MTHWRGTELEYTLGSHVRLQQYGKELVTRYLDSKHDRIRFLKSKSCYNATLSDLMLCPLYSSPRRESGPPSHQTEEYDATLKTIMLNHTK